MATETLGQGVYIYDTKTINLITLEIRMLFYSLNIYNVLDFNTLSN